METDDMELLREYVLTRSESAFRTLVERHIHMIYSVALRQTGQAQLAEDVSQAVFIVLAEKAATISKNTILAGWLFRATRFAAANAKRAEVRREHWEQKAVQMETPTPSEPELEQITPLLNEVIEQLPDADRAAILLRFFESKSMEEVGRALGTSEGAAKMRLSRAVEKLRNSFRQRGVVVPAATVLAVLSAQSAQAAPEGLASAVVTSVLLKQTSAAALPLVKETLIIMAQTKAKKLAIAAIVLLVGGATAFIVPQILTKKSARDGSSEATAQGLSAAEPRTVNPAADAKATEKVLVFRNIPSWNRHPDFEDALAELGLDFEVKPADLMATTDLSAYRFVIIPGAQRRADFYTKYSENAERFENYVRNGGTLVLELNGAERANLPLPEGVIMVDHPAKDNALTLPEHPVLLPMAGKAIHASYASHGYLSEVPKDATVLATESTDGAADPDKPTFIEYPVGKGRVIAACQCFHDRDGSGRGPMMQAVLSYATDKKWYAAKN